MSLPIELIDKVHSRLLGAYGREFLYRYAEVDEKALKSVWAHELASFSERPEAIFWALDNLPDKCPSAPQFRNLCRQAPILQAMPLEAPAADPARLRAELAKLKPVIRQMRHAPPSANRDWAKRILARAEAGASVAPCSLRMAREALGVTNVC